MIEKLLDEPHWSNLEEEVDKLLHYLPDGVIMIPPGDVFSTRLDHFFYRMIFFYVSINNPRISQAPVIKELFIYGNALTKEEIVGYDSVTLEKLKEKLSRNAYLICGREYTYKASVESGVVNEFTFPHGYDAFLDILEEFRKELDPIQDFKEVIPLVSKYTNLMIDRSIETGERFVA